MLNTCKYSIIRCILDQAKMAQQHFNKLLKASISSHLVVVDFHDF